MAFFARRYVAASDSGARGIGAVWRSSAWVLIRVGGERKEGESSILRDHLGGWHVAMFAYVPPRCARCDALPALVAQLDHGNHWRTLWACTDHADQAHVEVHQ